MSFLKAFIPQVSAGNMRQKWDGWNLPGDYHLTLHFSSKVLFYKRSIIVAPEINLDCISIMWNTIALLRGKRWSAETRLFLIPEFSFEEFSYYSSF